MKRTVLLLLMVVGAVVSSGCSDIQESVISTRNRLWSMNAWRQVKHDYKNPRVPRHIYYHFAKGWRNGYYAVAQSGGPVKLPLIPPQCYWGAHYQNPMGHDEVMAWFDGFQDGATAAEADGVGFWVEIPTSKGMRFETEVIHGSGAGGHPHPGGPPNVEQVPPGSPLDGWPPVEELPPSRTSDTQSQPINLLRPGA